MMKFYEVKRVTFLLRFLFSVGVLSPAFSMAQQITVQGRNMTLKSILDQVQEQTGYRTFGDAELLKRAKPVTTKVSKMDLHQFLSNILRDQPIAFKIEDRTIRFSPRTLDQEEKIRQSDSTQNPVQILGVVLERGNKKPVSGATISVMNVTGRLFIKTSSDNQGRLVLSNIPHNAKINITYVGRTAFEISVPDLQKIKQNELVTLENGTVVRSSTNHYTFEVISLQDNPLEEVVVVGYGVQKREHLTGAVSSVNADEVFGNRPIPDAARGLQGAIPGLNIRVPSGEVGSDPLLRIRGQVGSVIGGSSPLVLVDNVEVPSLQYVNSHDIETVTVLKDAASASIYGAKAAFGVVLITTKKGANAQRDEFTYSNNFVLQSPFKKIEIAGIEGAEYTWDAHQNMKGNNAAGGFWRITPESIRRMYEWQEKYGDKVNYDDPVLYNRDWYYDGVQKLGVRIYDPVKAMIHQNTLSHMHNLSLNGRRGSTVYRMGVGYLGQNGMMKAAEHDDYLRFNPSLKVSTRVNDYLTLRGSIMYAESRKRSPTPFNTGGYGADPWLYLYRWSRLFPIGVQENGIDLNDPTTLAKSALDAVSNNRFTNLNLGSTINIRKNWNVEVDYSYNAENRLNTSAVPYVQAKETWYGVNRVNDADGNPIFVDEDGLATDVGGEILYEFPTVDLISKQNTFVRRESFKYKRHTFNAFSTYNFQVKEKHDFKFMVGTNIIAYDYISHYARQREFLLSDDNPQFQFATGEREIGGSNHWESQAGFFGRFNYAFADKYLFEGNLRYDGTSKFPKDLKWRWFPSVSAGWVVSKENFMQALHPILSFAKLRASYGIIGDQTVSNNLYVPRMAIDQSWWKGGAGDLLYTLGTPAAVDGNIRWQDIEHLNIGADLRFFSNKLGVTAEWFQRYTKNMLIAGESLPATFGASAPTGNYGNLRTRGWEFNVDYTHRFEGGLRLSINANISDAVSYTTKGPDWDTPWENRQIPTTSGYSSESRYAFSTERRYGDVYGFVTDRLYQKDDFVYDSQGNFVTETIIRDGSEKPVHVLKGDNPVYQTWFQDGGPVMMISPGDVKFKDLDGDGFIDVGSGTNGDPGDLAVIGNITPRYEYGLRLAADYKGFDLAVFFQGVGKRSIWGDGQLAIPGYYAREGGMSASIARDYWREDRTDAFYPRAWNMNGSNSLWVMRPQSRYMLDMSYLKIKNITVGYNIPTRVLERIKLKNARFYVSLENFITFDNLRGLPIDPEAISGYSSLRESGYNLGRTGTSNPAFKSASAGLQIGF